MGTAAAALSQPHLRAGRLSRQTLPPGAKGVLLPTCAGLPGDLNVGPGSQPESHSREFLHIL